MPLLISQHNHTQQPTQSISQNHRRRNCADDPPQLHARPPLPRHYYCCCMYLCTLSGEGIHRHTAEQAEAAINLRGAHLAQYGTPACPGHSATTAPVVTCQTRRFLSAQPAMHIIAKRQRIVMRTVLQKQEQEQRP